jgi:hypothetical protein
VTCSCSVHPQICTDCIKFAGQTLKCKWCEQHGNCYIMHYSIKYYESPFEKAIHTYEKWENMISCVNSYFIPHSQIVRMGSHWGEFLKVNRLQPGKNDIQHATSDFFFLEFFYVTQTLPRDPSFFSNCDTGTRSQFEIKQHVAINKLYFLLLNRITLSKMLICKLFGKFQQSYRYRHLIHMYMMSNIQFWHQVAEIFRRI